MLHLEIVEHPDSLRFTFIDLQRSTIRLITQWNVATPPQPLALGGCNLVTNAFRRDLRFKLGEAQQYIQLEPPHAGAYLNNLQQMRARLFAASETVSNSLQAQFNAAKNGGTRQIRLRVKAAG